MSINQYVNVFFNWSIFFFTYKGEVHGDHHVGSQPSQLSPEQGTSACPDSGLMKSESEPMNTSFNDTDPVVTRQVRAMLGCYGQT